MSGDQPRFKEAPPELRSDDDDPADPAAPVVLTRDSPSPSENRAGNYLLDQLIEHGSSGDVWKAAAPDGSIVAVKIFKKELAANADALQRFNHEAKLLRRVSHPNLVALIDSGETADHVPFIVMEYIEGQTVKERLENESAFEPTAVAKIGREICRALSAAHAETIIHRDLKPSNIILTGDNDARIIDFGIAKAIGYTGETLTQLGGVVGTPAYMSPEQCLGSGIDERSDVYSLGCVLFEMLTGTKAFDTGNPVEAIAKHLHDDRHYVRKSLAASEAPRFRDSSRNTDLLARHHDLQLPQLHTAIGTNSASREHRSRAVRHHHHPQPSDAPADICGQQRDQHEDGTQARLSTKEITFPGRPQTCRPSAVATGKWTRSPLRRSEWRHTDAGTTEKRRLQWRQPDQLQSRSSAIRWMQPRWGIRQRFIPGTNTVFSRILVRQDQLLAMQNRSSQIRSCELH